MPALVVDLLMYAVLALVPVLFGVWAWVEWVDRVRTGDIEKGARL
jgi:hypothetical protein